MKILTMLLLVLKAPSAFSAGYDTLPTGVNTLVFKQVVTNKIESKYDTNSSNKTLMINEAFTTSTLSGISDAIKSYFDELKNLSPSAYDSFSLGEFEAKAWAQVNVQGIGFGHGITDHLTIYGSLPIYHLKTTVNFYQKSPSNLNQIKNSVISSNPTTALGNFVKQLTLQLPDSNEELLQSVLVNYYKYKPLGTWEKDTLGDGEIGGIYRLSDSSSWGLSLTLGAVIPTGSPDDPDSLQDVSTGDGQTDTFIESNTGINFNDNSLQLDLKTRFTYQFAANKKMRLYSDPAVPLGETSQILNEKLGNKLDATIQLTYLPKPWLNMFSAFIVNKTGQTNYDVQDAKIKNALEYGTETSSEWIKVGVGFSTIELYKKKQFEMPMEIILSSQKLVNGKNAADYNRYDLDFKLYF